MDDEDEDVTFEPQIQSPEIRAIRDRLRETVDSPEHQKATAERVARAQAFAQDQADREKRYRRRFANIPELYWELLDNPDERPALTAARAFMASDKLLFVLGGTGGVGKSFAAAWCVDRSGAEFIKAGTIGSHGQFDPMFWRQLAERAVLAIDELGQERMDRGGWLAGAFGDLLDTRILHKRKTVFTTNLAGKAFMPRYAEGDLARLKRRWDDYGQFTNVVTGATWTREPGSEG